MGIIDRFKRGEITIVELMEQLGRGGGAGDGSETGSEKGTGGRPMIDRRRQDRPVHETPCRRSTDTPAAPNGDDLPLKPESRAVVRA